MSKQVFNIAVLPGDGIGQEIMDVCIEVLQHLLTDQTRFGLAFTYGAGGAQNYADTGIAMPDATILPLLLA